MRRMLDVDIPGKRSRGRSNLRWKDGNALRNKEDRMEEEAGQLYRRPQMTGQAREDVHRASIRSQHPSL